jgi:hypothetical protein
MWFKNFLEFFEAMAVFLMRAVPEFVEIVLCSVVVIFVVYLFVYIMQSVLQ